MLLILFNRTTFDGNQENKKILKELKKDLQDLETVKEMIENDTNEIA